MHDENVDNAVKQSTKYSKFKFLTANREQNRGHIEALKRAFAEAGNLTLVQPILVNERYEIIDGQHRFIAAKEMGEPIYYSVRSGLRIEDARNMNVLHRSWTVVDYAESYAQTGNVNYQQYLELRAAYGFGHSPTLLYALGATVDTTKPFKDFREGNFVLEDMDGARDRLQKLEDVLEITSLAKDKYFGFAFLKVIQVEGYDHRRMLKKLNEWGEQLLRRYGSVADFLRVLEEIYNYKNAASNRLRLYN